ncbi:conjugative transposon protein TraM [Ancylomarina longa]|uniref:Conjugative transposon protein TraM n=1 Tax=Ancylomarina longa TaxID=2487017 RepID=A0A434AX12_9BACT|nr:conjugative transposon protein TraM [Ancylomarina longa]RUT78959.1 conjugative transposon protein TraM [Ancylomarina longa]
MKTYLKKNRALLILPLVLLPFIVLIFYILGGGEKAGNNKSPIRTHANQEGANYLLPEAEKSIEIFEKMEAYQSQNLSADINAQNTLSVNKESSEASQLDLIDLQADSLKVLLKYQTKADVSNSLLAHIKQKEELVRTDLNEDKDFKPVLVTKNLKAQSQSKTQFKATVNQSSPEENLIKRIADQQTGLEELEQVFDKNISLNRENDSLKYFLQEAQANLKISNQKKEQIVSLEKKSSTGFDKNKASISLIKAEVYETTTVLDGNRIKMRLLDDAWIEGRRAGKNTFFYGICEINNERLNIQVTRFPLEEHFLPVDLQIHDLDGLPGLYIPDNVARRVSKEIGSRTNTSSLLSRGSDPLSSIGINTADRTAQAFIKRVRLKKITIKKNTLVYLINQNQ